MINKLRALRKEKGLANWGLATLAGASPSTITAIEKWGFLPREETRQRIAQALGVATSDIWPDAEKEVQAQ